MDQLGRRDGGDNRAYVRHAQKIAKQFFSMRSTQFTIKLNISFKKIATSLAPKIIRLSYDE